MKRVSFGGWPNPDPSRSKAADRWLHVEELL